MILIRQCTVADKVPKMPKIEKYHHTKNYSRKQLDLALRSLCRPKLNHQPWWDALSSIFRTFGHSIFGFVSNFVLRISDFHREVAMSY
jgi:hypothetical protein